MAIQDATLDSIQNPSIAAIFGAYPTAVQEHLMRLRHLILDVASATDGVGELEETLKWGQPSYLTKQTKSGSLIRIDRVKTRTESQDNKYAMYFHCQTSLIENFKEKYHGLFEFEGNRAIIFSNNDTLPIEELRDCIALALTYNLNKKQSKTA
jgi:Domain of unknown function (DU1801)